MNLLNSPSRGNLVDGLPRAASDCWVGVYLNSNSGALGVPHGGSRSNIFHKFCYGNVNKSNIEKYDYFQFS